MSDLNNTPPTVDEEGNELLNEFQYTEEELAEIAKLDEKADSDNEDEENGDELDEDFVNDLLKDENEDEENLTDKEAETTTPPASQGNEDENNDPEIDPGTKTDEVGNNGQIEGENNQQIVEQADTLPNFDEQLDELDQQRQDAQGKVSDAFSKLEELGEQFDNGEIGQGKYDSQKALLERDIRKYENEVTRLDSQYEALSNTAAETIDTYNKTQAEKFNQELLNFVKKEENNYLMTNPSIAGEFDHLLKTLGASGVFEGMSNLQIIETVNNTVLIRHPELKTVTPKVNQEQKIEKQEKPPKPTHTDPKIPTSLSSIPPVEVNDQTDPFAHIRKLSGIDYEIAIQKLTPQQYQQFFGEEFLDY